MGDQVGWIGTNHLN